LKKLYFKLVDFVPLAYEEIVVRTFLRNLKASENGDRTVRRIKK